MVLLAICDGLIKQGIDLEQIFEMAFKFARMALEFAKDAYGELNLRSYIPYLAICELPQMVIYLTCAGIENDEILWPAAEECKFGVS